MEKKGIDRRSFLKGAAVAAAAIGTQLAQSAQAAEAPQVETGAKEAA